VRGEGGRKLILKSRSRSLARKRERADKRDYLIKKKDGGGSLTHRRNRRRGPISGKDGNPLPRKTGEKRKEYLIEKGRHIISKKRIGESGLSSRRKEIE